MKLKIRVYFLGLPGVSMVKTPANVEDIEGFSPWVREDHLEKGKATHSSILAWRIPWTVHEVTKSWTRLIYIRL